MSPLIVAALRRLALLIALLALGLVVYFEVLPLFGLVGPSVDEHIAAGRAALETARSYGALPEDEAFVRAAAGLAEAQRLTTEGSSFAARRAALAAHEDAIGAQRAALATREDARRRARTAIEQIDAQLNDLEDTYTAVSAGLDKNATNRLLSVMRGARQTGAGLFLAYEQDNFRKVIEEETHVRTRLGEAKATLLAARKPKP